MKYNTMVPVYMWIHRIHVFELPLLHRISSGMHEMLMMMEIISVTLFQNILEHRANNKFIKNVLKPNKIHNKSFSWLCAVAATVAVSVAATIKILLFFFATASRHT